MSPLWYSWLLWPGVMSVTVFSDVNCRSRSSFFSVCHNVWFYLFIRFNDWQAVELLLCSAQLRTFQCVHFCWILLQFELGMFPPNLMHLNTWSPAGADTSGGCEISKKWSLLEGIGSLETGRQETDIYFWFWPKLSSSWSADIWTGQSASFCHHELNHLGSHACPVVMVYIHGSCEQG